MQYVGKFVSTVYNTITPNINPATLSGAIDVIVVERTVETTSSVECDSHGNPLPPSECGKLPEHQRRYTTVKSQTTELASTPFHVRFGKMSVLRPAERKVTLHLNGSTDPLPFAMKVGESGEAFFVLEIDEDDEEGGRIPDELVTSPILSATTSPIAGPEDGEHGAGQGGEAAEVEPLELGEAEHLPPASLDSTDSDRNSTEKLKQNKQPGQPDDQGDLNVPSDSTKTGSGSAAGSDSMLNKVGSAASKASGVLGAVIGSGGTVNPRLDKTAETAQRSDKTDNMTGAPVDQDRQDAHHYEPEQGGPQGKKRQEEQEDAVESSTFVQPANETERLERELQQKAMEVVEDEARSDADGESVRSIDSAEEAYPAPFGASAKGSSKSKTKSVASIHHSEYLGGMRLNPVPIGDGARTIDPAMTDASTHRHIYEQRQRKRSAEGKADDQNEHNETGGDDDDGEDTAVDDEDDADGEVVGAVKVKQRKEDLQYMLDMDGYKMTQDGEDLAYQEGHRFADEMPLSRRHGGKGRHGHPDLLNGSGHQHKVSLPGTSTASMRRGSGSRTHRPSFSVEYRNQRTSLSQSREREARRESLDDTAAANLSKFESQYGVPHLGGGQSAHQDELELSRDLARLARMNRAAEHGADPRARGRRQPKGPESLRRYSSLSGRNKQGKGRRENAGKKARHVHEFSLSDTEAEVPNAKSTSAHGSIENSTEALRAEYGVSDVVKSLRDLRLPSEEAPAYLDDASASHLGLSGNSRWQWSDPVADSSASTPTGQPRRHTRFASSDGVPVRPSDASALEALRRHTAEGEVSGKLTSSDSEPYTFLLQLEDSSHSFELSLCYGDSFGQDEEADEYAFLENRVSFERFAHDQDVVNDERLVIRYHDRFLTWENASAVLATLSLYRRTLAGNGGEATNLDDDGEDDEKVSKSYWSRWFKRSSKSIPDLKQVADAEVGEDGEKSKDGGEAVLRGQENLPHRSNTDSALLGAGKADVESLGKQGAKPSAAAAAHRVGKTYAKTLRLTSDQLKSLNLRKGSNSITFSVTSSYSGVATCSARIFVWESNHKIVVSDIDGTITKSDALGHVFTMIGRDWTHIGVAKLYTDIARNGYRIMYLTSRAIGQADSTRDYLKGIRQNGYQLPDGPVIMSPDRLIASLHREVILRKPEVFKMACLRDIARLFGADPRTASSQPGGDLTGVDEDVLEKAQKGAGADDSPAAGAATASASASASATPTESTFADSVLDGAPPTDVSSIRSGNLSPTPSSASLPTLASIPPLDPQPGVKKEEHPTPFYAGFGNRITDALSYRSVNIPSSRIFTIDTNGEVKMELLELAGYKSSYIHMTDLVDQMFPPITAKEEKEPRKPEYNDFNYWRPAIVDIELPDDEELLGTPPVSPALSARSGRSLRSVRSVTSDTTAGGGGGEKMEDKPGRLSRFGLGSLGLSRKGSQSGRPEHANTIGPGITGEELDRKTRAISAEPALETAGMTSSTSGSSWTAPWRRRAASPDTEYAQRATSPLVGPVITAEPEMESEDEREFYDSEGADDNDDVSSFGGSRSRLNSFDAGEAEGQEGVPGKSQRKVLQRLASGRSRLSEDDVEAYDEDEGEDEEMDDELLETGEIRFEWKG
ncbi:nuclear elongation and deformation protein [Pseudozyma hubeiensis SY62]|uniref:phosphatidate phosphatase n=1 Tax=Pseudozyma hubeiensis (strain SY62) TaxID=1305764 RepID=R9P702_PSEHS|nr:nuclear elongation and deformation protein [Pseudozyma hubeiensis SY62]GAC93845.1 nuclear elongation and deformation protein [Pseudozyma hubeiensis SY62]